jgi:hypothetical protein
MRYGGGREATELVAHRGRRRQLGAQRLSQSGHRFKFDSNRSVRIGSADLARASEIGEVRGWYGIGGHWFCFVRDLQRCAKAQHCRRCVELI